MRNRINPGQGPTTLRERIASLDVLRAFALMGILVVNIAIFAIPDKGANPYAYSNFQGANYWVKVLTDMLFRGNFHYLFSMMFGAGVCLMAQRLEEKGLKPGLRHYRRMFWLIAIGFLHFSLLWGEDILFSYGFAGLALFPFIKFSPKKTLVYTIIFLSILSMKTASISASGGIRSPRQIQAMEKAWQPQGELRQQRMDQYKISWWELTKTRASIRWRLLRRSTFWYIILINISIMLVGMTLFKFGLLTGKAPLSTYKKVFFWGLAIGLVLPVLGAITRSLYEYQFAYLYRPKNLTFGMAFLKSMRGNVTRLLLPLAYMSGIILLAQWDKFKKLTAYMAAMGRMALTNYIMMSLICTNLFFGYGWNLYGKMDRTPLILIVFAILLFQLWFSYHWLSKYRFGPVEWIWRSLTYSRHQPMRLPGES